MTEQAQLDLDCRVAGWKAAMRTLQDGLARYLVVIRADYSLKEGGSLEPCVESGDIPLCDIWASPDDDPFPIQVGELLPEKVGREIYWLGDVMPGKVSLEVSTRDGQRLEKAVTVTRPCHWKKGWLGMQPEEDAGTVKPVPLSWAESFGGICPVSNVPHPLNPSGRGFRTKGRPEAGESLPRIHPADKTWSRPLESPEPDNLAPIPEAWRDQWSGSDEPGCAVPDQRLEGCWEEGDELTLRTADASGAEVEDRIVLPQFAPRAVLAGSSGASRIDGRWDTLIVDTSEPDTKIAFLWRGQFDRIQPSRPEWLIIDA